jgi:hypothetical protein
MGSAIETRDVLSKLEGVIRCHPVGKEAFLYVADEKLVGEQQVKAALAKTKDLRLEKVEKIERRTGPV